MFLYRSCLVLIVLFCGGIAASEDGNALSLLQVRAGVQSALSDKVTSTSGCSDWCTASGGDHTDWKKMCKWGTCAACGECRAASYARVENAEDAGVAEIPVAAHAAHQVAPPPPSGVTDEAEAYHAAGAEETAQVEMADGADEEPAAPAEEEESAEMEEATSGFTPPAPVPAVHEGSDQVQAAETEESAGTEGESAQVVALPPEVQDVADEQQVAGAAESAGVKDDAERVDTAGVEDSTGAVETAGVEDSTAAVEGAAKPHILFILADDLGYANVGFTRSEEDKTEEVDTPQLDKLAAEGVVLTHMYVHYMCSPTRSALQSGRNPIHVNVVQAELSSVNKHDPVGGFAGIPRNMTGLGDVMRSGGYKTHFVGKWDAGMATPDHTPAGRGYDTSLGFFGHANDYWTFKGRQKCNENGGRDAGLLDLWEMNNETEFPGRPARGLLNSADCSDTSQGADRCVYEDELFANQVKSIIRAHDETAPLFVFWAAHAPHAPMQVPSKQLKKFDFITEGDDSAKPSRQIFSAMVNWLDGAVGEVVQELKDANLYDNTLIVFSSDNGGAVGSGGNNYPLKGGKYSTFEGGIRVPAFISGGFVPEKVRNTHQHGLMAGWDWYGTFARLAGVDPTDHRAAAAGLPAVDSADLWPLLSGATETPARTELIIGSIAGGVANRDGGRTVVAAIIVPPYKLVVGQAPGDYEPMAAWSAPIAPNKSSPTETEWMDSYKVECGRNHTRGCLYNVWEDDGEHINIASFNEGLFAALLAKVEGGQTHVYSPERNDNVHETKGPNQPMCLPAFANSAKETTGELGFLGPFLA